MHINIPLSPMKRCHRTLVLLRTSLILVSSCGQQNEITAPVGSTSVPTTDQDGVEAESQSGVGEVPNRQEEEEISPLIDFLGYDASSQFLETSHYRYEEVVAQCMRDLGFDYHETLSRLGRIFAVLNR